MTTEQLMILHIIKYIIVNALKLKFSQRDFFSDFYSTHHVNRVIYDINILSMKIFILLALVVCSFADTLIETACHQCGQRACLVMKGGGFTGVDIQTSSRSCQDQGRFPGQILFECGNGDCGDGCFMTRTSGDFVLSYCTNSDVGVADVAYLNQLYSIQKGDTGLTSTYDWCNCGLSNLAIIGIIVLVLVVVGAIVGGIYFYKKKQQDSSGGYGAMRDSRN